MVAETIARNENPKLVKEEFLNSLRESDTVEERAFNLRNIINQNETIHRIKRYEEIIKTGNKKQ